MSYHFTRCFGFIFIDVVVAAVVVVVVVVVN